MATPTLTVNGRALAVDDVDPHTTVLDFLRDRGLVGTKEGCAEGECGACAVILVRPDGSGGDEGDGDERARYVPVNSCLTLVGSVVGGEVLTVEGLRPAPGALHPVQQAMVDAGGSQCGYCTPGFVVSMFAEYYRRERPDWDPESVAGNLCRCTGYRPIREAMRSLSRPDPVADPFLARLARPAPDLRGAGTQQLLQIRQPRQGGPERSRRLLRPASLDELLTLLAAEPEAKLIAGGTDVVVAINQNQARWPLLISLEAITELQQLTIGADWVEIGAGVPLSTLEHRLHDLLPLFAELLPLFSSRLIRNRATLGGNLVNASPIGDSPPVLLALDAELSLVSVGGRRSVPVAEFFTGYRKTVLQAGEVVHTIRVPRRRPDHARFYKVSKRVLDDISTVAAAFSLDLDDAGLVRRVRLAYGGVAATPARAHAAEDALLGKPWTRESVTAVTPTLAACFSPMSDHRGSADYRRAMVVRLLEKFLHDTAPAMAAVTEASA